MYEQLIFSDHETLSAAAAELLAARLRAAPDALLCLATGSTPMRTYELFTQRARQEPRLCSRARVIMLDEWGGLAADNPASCDYHLRSALIDPLDLSGRYQTFDSRSADPAADCARVAAWLAEHGPIDTCVLGLGLNGHVGFNEPAAYLQPNAHVAELSAATLTHAMLNHAATRPNWGVTLGMADLLHAGEILLLVSGESKCQPLARLLSGQITTDFPGSLLLLHPRLRILCDEAAVGKRLEAGVC